MPTRESRPANHAPPRHADAAAFTAPIRAVIARLASRQPAPADPGDDPAPDGSFEPTPRTIRAMERL